MNWMPHQDEQLARLVADGLSAGKIAEQMRITRNAVIGRIRRINLQLHGKSGNPACRKTISIVDQRKKNVRGGKPNIKRLKSRAKADVEANRVGVDRAEAKAKAPYFAESVSRGTVEAAASVSHVPGFTGGRGHGRDKPVSAEAGHAPIPRRIALMDLEWQDCRWIEEGEGEHALFCGDPAQHRSYCRRHADLAYQAPEVRKRERMAA